MVRKFHWQRLVTMLFLGAVALTLTLSRPGQPVVLADVLERVPAEAAATTHLINYQGRLVDPTTGAPKADGTYSMTFRIYTAATGGTILWTEIKDITVTKGLFATLLGDTTALDQNVFDGNDRWLGVKVGSDAETSPRMRLAFVPYASYALNAGMLGGQNSAYYRNATNLNAGTVADARIPAAIARDSEVFGIVTGADGAGSGLDADLLDGQDSAFYRNATNINAGTVADARVAGTLTRDSEVFGIVTSADGAGSGLDADLLDGMDSGAFAATSHNHSGAQITSGVVADARIADTLTRDSEVFGIVTGADGAGSGLDADLLDGMDSGAFAGAGHNHDTNYVNQVGPESITGSSNTEAILFVKQTGSQNGIFATTDSTDIGEAGIHGRAVGAGFTINSVAGVFGDSSSGRGVIGSSMTHDGVFGFSDTSTGVNGQSLNGNGVEGLAGGSSGVTYGVKGITNSTNNGAAGVRGESSQVGVWGHSSGYVGVWGSSAGRWAVYGATTGSSSSYGVYGTAPSGTGNFAGYFSGNVNVTGSIAKGSGTFKIDHPLDPENKYLSHSFVESPDMMNVYNGNATLGDDGSAWVDLPSYFQALNRDFRYQLTAIGGPGPNLHIAQEIQGNRFQIAGGAAGLRVSWQVTGIRQDAYANANRVVVEQEKPENERGTYLHPEVFGQDRSRGVDFRLNAPPLTDPTARPRDGETPLPVAPAIVKP